jgi:iron complex outermembrane receptor protein
MKKERGCRFKRHFIAMVFVGIVLTLVPGTRVHAEETFVLRGRVADTTGAVLVGAAVRLSIQTTGEERVATSDARGEFRFDKVPDGRHELRVSHPGFAEAHLVLEVSRNEELVEEILLEPATFSEEVTITATRIETPVTALPKTVTVLDRDVIDEQTALRGDLVGVLEVTVPGYGPSLSKLTGRAESLRGRNPLYTINGVSQHNALRDGQRDGHTIDLDFVDRIEVVHGSSALQGIGATGGVVNLVTKSPRSDGQWTHDVRFSVGTHDSFDSNGFSPKFSYLVGKQAGRLDFTTGFSFHKRDLFFDANGDAIGLYPTQGDIMDSSARNLYFKGGFDVEEKQRIELTFNTFRLERDGDYVVVRGDRETGQVTTTEPGDPRLTVGDPALNDVKTLSVDYRHQDLLGGEVALQGYYQDYRALFEGGTFGDFFRLTPDGPPFLDQSEIDSEKLGVNFMVALPSVRFAGITPTVGLDVGRDKTVQLLARSGREWVPETTLANVAPFFQLQRPVGRFLLTGGIRFEVANLGVDDFVTIAAAGNTFVSGGDPTYTEVLPNLGVVFTATPGVSLYGSYSEGFTMPDVGRVLRGINRPDQDVDDFIDLQPIVTNNLEFGVDFRHGPMTLHTAFYRSTASLGSRLDMDDNGIFHVRREPTEIDGVDVVVDFDITERFGVGGTYAWIRGRFDSDGDGTVDTDLDGMNVAPNRINVFFDANMTSWMTARFQTSTLLDREFQGPAAPEGRDFEGFTIADLLFVFNSQVGIFRVGLTNLLDEQYLTYFAQTEPAARSDTIFAGQGRSFTLQYERRF